MVRNKHLVSYIHLDLNSLILWLPLQWGLNFSIGQNFNSVAFLLCTSKCRDTLCFGNPDLMFFMCSRNLFHRGRLVLPMYCREQELSNTTHSVRHEIKSLMSYSFFVALDMNLLHFCPLKFVLRKAKHFLQG